MKSDWRKVVGWDNEYPTSITTLGGEKPLPKSIPHRRYSTDWFPMDTEEQWLSVRHKKNIEYSKNDFSYDLNSNFFRCDDFDDILGREDDILVTMGCSLTFGTGVPESVIWPTILGKLIEEHTDKKVSVVNLATPGGSIDLVNLYSMWLSKFSPKYFVVMSPVYHRQAYFHNGKYDVYYPHFHTDGRDKELFEISKKFLEEPYHDNLEYREEFSFRMLKNIAKSIDARHVIKKSSYFRDSPEHIKLLETYDGYENVARDGQHPGSAWHKCAADVMFKELFNE